MKKQYTYSAFVLCAILSGLSFAGAPVPAAPPPARHNVNEILGDANDFKASSRRGANARIIAAREALVEPMVAGLMLQAVIRHWAEDTEFGTQARALLNQLNPPARQAAPQVAPAPAMHRALSTQDDLAGLDDIIDLSELDDPPQAQDTTTGDGQATAAAASATLPAFIGHNHALTEIGARTVLEQAKQVLNGPEGLDVFDIGLDLQIIAARNGADTIFGAEARLLLVELRRRGRFETDTANVRQYVADLEAHAAHIITAQQITEARRTLELLVERDRLFEETRQIFEAEAARRELEAERAMQQATEPQNKRYRPEGNDDQFNFEDDYLDFVVENEPIAAPVFPPILPVEPDAPMLTFLQGANVQALVAHTLAAIATVTPVAVKAARVNRRRK